MDPGPGPPRDPAGGGGVYDYGDGYTPGVLGYDQGYHYGYEAPAAPAAPRQAYGAPEALMRGAVGVRRSRRRDRCGRC